MPFYHKLGSIPHKRHTIFRKPDGGYYREEVMGTRGFSGIESILYHTHPPTEVKLTEKLDDLQVAYADFGAIRHRHFKTRALPGGGYYRNGDNWELLFMHE